MLSVMCTHSTLIELVNHLRSVMLVETDDEQPFMLRFADTEALGAFAAALRPEQLSAFMGAIDLWWFAKHNSSLVCLERPDVSTQERVDPPLRIQQEQLDNLMRGAIPSLVSSQLCEMDDAFTRAFRPAQRIDFVLRNAGRASQQGLANDSEIQAWCFAAWLGGEHFYESNEGARTIADYLNKDRAGDLLVAFGELTDEQWLEMRQFSQEKERPLLSVQPEAAQ